MKATVIYATMTGHSRKLAKAIAAELGISHGNISEKPQLSEQDLLFIVGGIYSGQPSPELLEYVKGIDSKKASRVALVTSCTSGKTRLDAVRSILKENGVEVLEQEYICKGSFLFMAFRRPNKAEIAQGAQFAREIYESCK